MNLIRSATRLSVKLRRWEHVLNTAHMFLGALDSFCMILQVALEDIKLLYASCIFFL